MKEAYAVRRTVPPSAEIEEQIDRLLAVGVGENPRESLSELAKLGARLIIQRAVEEEFDAWLGRARYMRQPQANAAAHGLCGDTGSGVPSGTERGSGTAWHFPRVLLGRAGRRCCGRPGPCGAPGGPDVGRRWPISGIPGGLVPGVAIRQ